LRFRFLFQRFDFAFQKRMQIRQRLELQSVTLGARFHQRAFAGEKRVDLGNLFHLRRLGDDRVTLDLGDQPRLTGKQPCALVVVNGCVAAGIYEVAGKTLPGIGYLLDAESEMPAGEAGEVDEGDVPLETEERNLAKA